MEAVASSSAISPASPLLALFPSLFRRGIPVRYALCSRQRNGRLSVEAKQRVPCCKLASAVRDAVRRIAGTVAAGNASFTFLVANGLAAALPAIAEEEKGKIFDFNLTLPIIAVEFLLLMVVLDNVWFKPVAKVMDERDEAIRQKLLGVRDNSAEINQLQEEAEAIIKAARAETTVALNQMKRDTAAALDQKLQQSRERIEKELAAALLNLEVKKEETLKSLDQQVQALSEEIIRKVVPFEV